MDDEQSPMSTNKWQNFLNEFMPSPMLGPFGDFTINAQERVALVETLLNIPPADMEEYMAAFLVWFNKFYPGADGSESPFNSTFREIHAILHACNDEQVAPLRALPDGWKVPDPTQRFTGQDKQIVRPSGWTTFGEVVTNIRALVGDNTLEE